MWMCDDCEEINDGSAATCSRCRTPRHAEESLWHAAAPSEPASPEAERQPYGLRFETEPPPMRPNFGGEPPPFIPNIGDTPPPFRPNFDEDNEPAPSMPTITNGPLPRMPGVDAPRAPYEPSHQNEEASYIPLVGDRAVPLPANPIGEPAPYQSGGVDDMAAAEREAVQRAEAARAAYYAPKPPSKALAAFGNYVVIPLLAGCSLFFTGQSIRSHQMVNQYQSACTESTGGTHASGAASGICRQLDVAGRFREKEGFRDSKDLYVSFSNESGQNALCHLWRHSGFNEKVVTPDYPGNALIKSKIFEFTVTQWKGQYTDVTFKGVRYQLDDNPENDAHRKLVIAWIASAPILTVLGVLFVKRGLRRLKDLEEERDLRQELSRAW